MKDRILALRKHLKLSQTEFGERIGLKKSAISLIESGRNPASDQTCLLICTVFHVSMDWLRTGEGPMLAEHNSPDAQLMRQYAFSALVGKLLMTFGELPEQQQEQLLRRAKELAADVIDVP